MSERFLPKSDRPWTSGDLVESGDRIFLTDGRGDSDEKTTDNGPTAGELRSSASRPGSRIQVHAPSRLAPRTRLWAR